MSKYGSGLTSNEVCRLEIKECKDILKRYKVSKEDTEAITNMIKEAYFQLENAYISARAHERMLKETCNMPEAELFRRYREVLLEEAKRYEPKIKIVD